MRAVSFLVSYLSGSFHFSYLAGRAKGVDIRDMGTGNTGASNALIELGPVYGIITAVCDVLKAVIPVLVMGLVSGGDEGAKAAAVAGSVLGHDFPLFLKFRGGKGTSTVIGATVPHCFWMAVAMFAALIVGTVTTDYISMGSLCMIIISVPMALYVYGPGPMAAVYLCVFVLMCVKHLQNYRNMGAGVEKTFFATVRKKRGGAAEE